MFAICSPRICNPFAAKWQVVRSRRGRFIVPAYPCSPRIRNPFRIHSHNVRNVFVICVLHIRRVKVWFLRCKKVVFELQKYGFCFLNVVLVQFVCNVIAICQQHFGNPFAAKWQSVRSRRGSIYRARIYVYTHEMENGYVRAVKRKHVFGNVWIRAR